MTDAASRTTVIVFARAPVPGQSKTRLIPHLGAEGAARLHAALIERSLETARAAGLGSVELCCTPDASHGFFLSCAERYGVVLTAQSPGSLGTRMSAAFERVVPEAGPALLIGTDCPALGSGHLRDAAAALAAGNDAVLVPAEDGGYVLVGLARPSPRAFEDIEWGGADVLRDTRARFATLGWRWHELAELWDVDRPADLARLEESIDDGRRYLAAAMNAGADHAPLRPARS